MTQIAKGKSEVLYYALDSKNAIQVGLSWDPKVKASVGEKLSAMVGGNPTHTDLDLAAYVYDADHKFIGLASAKAEDIAIFTPHIYHSGDNMDGEGAGDDEIITVELNDLDASVHHILFKASSASGHLFAEIDTPKIRLLRSGQSAPLLETQLTLQQNKSALVFARLYKDNKGNWHYENIEEFTHANENKNWPDDLKIYLK